MVISRGVFDRVVRPVGKLTNLVTMSSTGMHHGAVSVHIKQI